MKKLLFFLVILIVTPVFAQDETLLPKKFESGYFGGPVLKVGAVCDKSGILVGGGWIVNHSHVIGGGGYYLINDIGIEDVLPDSSVDLMIAYGGPEFEYINQSHKLIHYTICTLVGVGVADYRDYESEDLDLDIFFVLEPTANVMLNLTHMLRIGLGAGYRYAYDVELEGVGNKNLSGPSAALTVKVGRF
jgi:hypothetical protein